MRQKVHLNLYRLGAAWLLLGLVTACGQKGQLVRPGENSAGLLENPERLAVAYPFTPPLWKRGDRGDFQKATFASLLPAADFQKAGFEKSPPAADFQKAGFEKSPPAPLFQRGEVTAVVWCDDAHTHLPQPPDFDKDARYAPPT